MTVSVRDHGSSVALVMVLVAGCLLLSLGLGELLRDSSTHERYDSLAHSITGSQDAEDIWDHWRRLPTGAVAWVEVEGTGISLPVADGSRGDTWYLTHDLWGNESALGCPFVDPRCMSPNNAHVMVYGHHLAFTSYMFSPLRLCFRQDRFAGLGRCWWTTSSGTCELAPLCSLSVDYRWQPIRRFSFADQDEFRAWLVSMVEASSARADDALERARDARRVVTLVTCSSIRPGQPWRTVVLFAA